MQITEEFLSNFSTVFLLGLQWAARPGDAGWCRPWVRRWYRALGGRGSKRLV